MTDQEVLKLYKELEEHYGDKLANYDHYPRIFEWQVRIYRYYKWKQEQEL